MRFFSYFFAALVLLSASAFAGAHPSYSPYVPEDTVPFYPGGTYDADIPHPNEFLQHPLGRWPMRYHELAAYVQRIAELSPRVAIDTYALSHEGRALFNVYISSEANMARMAEIRDSIGILADPSRTTTEAAARQLASGLPAVARLAYSIHGDEVSGCDAAIMLIYQLAAGNDEATAHLRDELFMIIDPTENPDGRERYLTMLQTYKSKTPNYDRFAMQHQGVWPWGRTNHYWFDMNRDWIVVTQPETAGRVKNVVDWHPQLVVDGHEMGSNDTYLFSPPREPINYNTPENVLKWWPRYAEDQASALDRRGWPYYTGEWNDQWYPGYASAWPTFFGSVGILYEMAGVDGRFVKQRDDYLLTYHEAVNKQFTSSLANLTTTANNRLEILTDYWKARASIVQQGRKSGLTFLFVPDGDEVKTKWFIERLTAQGIKVTRATEPFSVAACTDIYHESARNRSFPAGTYIVSTAQPHGALAKAVLDFDPHLKLSFLEEERRQLEKYGDTKMYEVSAWSVPLAYDMDAYMTTSAIKTASESVTEVPLSTGKVVNPDARYGYVIDMIGEKTHRILRALFDHDVVVYASEKEFTIEGNTFQPGALVLRRRGNREDLGDIVAGLADDIGVTVYGVTTGYSSDGSHLGAPTFRLLQKPKLAIFVGDGMDYTSTGSQWYALDFELGIPQSLLNAQSIGHGTPLSQYNVIVVPSCWAPLSQTIGDGGVRALKNWVRDGGTLILSGRSAAWAADSAGGLSQVRLRRQVLDKLSDFDLALEREMQAEAPSVDTMALWHPEKATTPDDSKGESAPPMSKDEAEKLDEWQTRFFPRGVLMRANLDTDHWLTFGMKDAVPTMMYTRNAFMAGEPVNTVARLADENDLRLSGLLWPEARRRWANTAWLTQERNGSGQIIMFATDPDVRAYFYGTRKLLLNAVLYGPGMGASFEGPYEQ